MTPRKLTFIIATLAAVTLGMACKKAENTNIQTFTPDQPGSTSQARQGNSRLLELPATHKGELIIYHIAYTLSFNTEHNNPNWVAWELTREEVNGQGRRANDFKPDSILKEQYRVTEKDYSGSGYDRGHMCPAGDNKWDAHAMSESFYMSNMCPQNHELNSRWWDALERQCRHWARREGSIYIVCGPIYDSNRKQKKIGREHKVTVPDAFFKCVLSLKPGQEKGIGFIYKNNEKTQIMDSVAVSIDSVEQVTGYDFFNNIDKKIEKRVEAQCNLKTWN